MISRRETLVALAASPVAAQDQRAGGAKATPLSRGDFEVSGAYLNAASTHPLPLRSAAAIRAFTAARIDPVLHLPQPDARGLFAKLINAQPEEIAYVPSTTYSENFVVEALGLKQPGRGRRIVTDVLHFDGSLYMYQELGKRGLDVVVLPMTADRRIDLGRLEGALTGQTQLVAISLVSKVNGFEHDLKAVCDIAHRKGALVYVDAVQAAGAIPIDVRASGVDFLAASTYKWLMGDFGFGFLYVRRDLLPRLQRAQFGFRQFRSFDYHVLPGDPPGLRPYDAVPQEDAAGHFEVGTLGSAGRAAAAASIEALLATGVDTIQRDRQTHVERIRTALSDRFEPLTPSNSRSGIIAFAALGAQARLERPLAAAGVSIALYENRFRISPSVYTIARDVDRLLDVLVG